ncbi:outer membrane beta-barrel protein [Cytophaga aurantiaca]|uniref:outer membrane beta-barrel protein n=1 Tax=Cytophaga aurantiaca TaxID=29530 RepID=UPI0012F77F23|nr:outer membrane beta-barrel protein [Cytophaga aurantiaca]
MKKNLLVLIVIALLAHTAMAQKAYFGFRAGAANPNYYGSDFKDVKDSMSIKNIWTPTVGFYVNSVVNDYFWIKTEFNYVNRGYTHKESGQTLRTNYYCIDVYPVTPTFHYKGAQLFAGPSVSLIVASQRDSLIAGQVKKISDNKMDGLNRYDLGIMAGFEYEFNFGLNLGVRMTHGFTSVYEKNSTTNVQTQWFNQTYLFTVGYSIGRKKEL